MAIYIVRKLAVALIVLAVAPSAALGAGGSGADSVLSAQIKEADGVSGQDTNSGSGIKTGHIQDGAVTDSKISGPISKSKLPSLANVVLVAKSGGDFTSIAAAIASVSPTDSSPVTIRVMPGTYDEGQTIYLKSNVTLQADAAGTVTIHGPLNLFPLVQGVAVANVVVTGITFDGGLHGMRMDDSSNVKITTNIFRDFYNYGIVTFRSSVIVQNNFFTLTGATMRGGIGIVTFNSVNVIKDNRFEGNFNVQNSTGMGDAIDDLGSQSLVVNNVFTDIAEGISASKYNEVSSTETIIGNYFANSFQSLSYPSDIGISESTALISNNVLMRGVANQLSTVRGKFNSDLAGNEIVLP